MSFTKLYNQVLSKDLCASCGLCESVCPEGIIKISSSTPKLLNSAEIERCGSCSLCSDICPGEDPETPESEMALFGRKRTEEERWLGVFDYTINGYSNDEEIYENSASGGCTTSTLLAAKEHLELDYVLVAGNDKTKKWLGQSQLATNKDEIMVSTQSKYQLFPHLKGLKPFIQSLADVRLGISGLPCQVQAIRKLQRLDHPIGKWAREHILFVVEIACSSNTTFVGTETLITEQLQLKSEDVKRVAYREGEYPGDFVVTDKDDTNHKIELWEAVSQFKGFKTHRCLSCGDWMSGLADVSFCDGDPNIFASSINPSDIDKQGKMVIRTEIGDKIIQYAIAEKKLTYWEGEIKTMNLGLERKKNRRATYERIKCNISKPPIVGYLDEDEIISDERLLKISGSPKDKLLFEKSREQTVDKSKSD